MEYITSLVFTGEGRTTPVGNNPSVVFEEVKAAKNKKVSLSVVKKPTRKRKSLGLKSSVSSLASYTSVPRSTFDATHLTHRERESLRRTKTFRRIQADLKEQTKRKLKNQDGKQKRLSNESYVDKARQIAVGAGAEDLRGDILKYRGDILRSQCEAESEVYLVYILLQQAEHEMRQKQPQV